MNTLPARPDETRDEAKLRGHNPSRKKTWRYVGAGIVGLVLVSAITANQHKDLPAEDNPVFLEAVASCDVHGGVHEIIKTNTGRIVQCNDLVPGGGGFHWGFPVPDEN